MSVASLTDLAACGPQTHELTADVCIIGAGAAGIYLGTHLAERGISVVLLEAGAGACVDGAAMGFEPEYGAEHYRGASVGRYFGLGGSTSRWGGQLVPHTQHDHRREPEVTDPWRHITQVVAARSHAVLQRLGFGAAPEFETYALRMAPAATKALRRSGLSVQAGLMMPFRRKNFAKLLEGKRAGTGTLRVYLNTIVNDWGLKNDAAECRVASVSAVSPNGERLIAKSSRFVIAAGALESARMLLELQSVSNDSALPPSAATGSYLADHLSVAIADVERLDANKAVSLFAPRFQHAWMRSFRFLESAASPHAPRAFAHFIFSDPGVGFMVAKQVLGAVQSRRMPQVTLRDLLLGTTGLCQLAYHRFARSTLYVSPTSPMHLQLDVEQIPTRENCVRLGATKDRYGRRHAQIHWRVSDADREHIQGAARSLLDKWPGPNAGLPRLTPRALSDGQIKPHDAYHPVGTCRMGEDSEAVVDLELRVRGLTNLWVASTAVLPSAGTANPTFTMLCLVEQMAQQLCESR